jgi:transmembrane sensor
MSVTEDIQRSAAHWLIRRDQGERAPAEQAQFEAWLAADSRHRVAYLELERTWRESEGLKAWRPHDGVVDAAVLRRSSSRASGASRHWPLALAGSLLLAIAGAFIWLAAPRSLTYATEIGGYQRVLLKDGSTVQLNTDTQVDVQLAERRRQVRLIRGEAFFNVTQDSGRPFEVIAGDTVVRAIGTAFTVRMRDPSDIEVIVTEGRVRVQPADPNAATIQSGTAAPPPALSAGEGAVARPAGIAVRKISQPEVARRLAWQAGELEFRGESLIQVISEFNRYNHTRLEIADPKLAVLEVGGNFRATDLDAFIRALEASFPVRAYESGDVIRLEARE